MAPQVAPARSGPQAGSGDDAGDFTPRGSTTGISRRAATAYRATATRNDTRGPADHDGEEGPTAPLVTKSSTSPPTTPASSPDEPVATLLRPMYRPAEARGMISVISAQSTARNEPAATAKRAAPATAKTTIS
jgi:hypothetical protein